VVLCKWLRCEFSYNVFFLAGTRVNGPWIEIIEQPNARGLGFHCDRADISDGSLHADKRSQERKAIPSIKVRHKQHSVLLYESVVSVST